MLTLYRGDDYAGQLGKKLTIHLSLDEGLPLDGLKAVLEFYDIKKEFTPIQYENDFTVEVSHKQSKKYPLGVSYAKLYCVDSSGKIRTFCNRIPICVTTDLRKVYGSDGLDKQDVHVYALVHWDNIAGKPDYFPTTIEVVEGLEEALRQAGKVKTVNNIEPDENGNIQIDIPECKVVSVNGKDGIVILNAGDIGYGEDSTVDSALAEAAASAANAISVANSKLSADDVVPETIANGVKIATIGGKEIKAPQGGGGGDLTLYREKLDINNYERNFTMTNWRLVNEKYKEMYGLEDAPYISQDQKTLVWEGIGGTVGTTTLVAPMPNWDDKIVIFENLSATSLDDKWILANFDAVLGAIVINGKLARIKDLPEAESPSQFSTQGSFADARDTWNLFNVLNNKLKNLT